MDAACPLCGAPLDPTQEWCLSCGAAARTRLAAPTNWKAPIVAIAVIATLALGVLAARARQAQRRLGNDHGSGARHDDHRDDTDRPRRERDGDHDRPDGRDGHRRGDRAHHHRRRHAGHADDDRARLLAGRAHRAATATGTTPTSTGTGTGTSRAAEEALRKAGFETRIKK